MVNTYYTDQTPLPPIADGVEPEQSGRRLVSEMEEVRSAELWRTPAFWEETVFEVLSVERGRFDQQLAVNGVDAGAAAAAALAEQVIRLGPFDARGAHRITIRLGPSCQFIVHVVGGPSSPLDNLQHGQTLL